MKVLLTPSFEWVDAEFQPKSNKIVNKEGMCIYETSIAAIEDDTRSKYVKCKSCGEVLSNNKRAIDAHMKRSDSSDYCLECPYMRVTNEVTHAKKFTINPDGTYTKATKTKCDLVCGVGYRNIKIDSESARTGCLYGKCKAQGTEHFEDTFSKYPGVFDVVATIDGLDPKHWKFEGMYPDRYIYKAIKRFELYAVANTKGIIIRFDHYWRKCKYSFVYSKKYGKVFWQSGERKNS